MKTFSGPKNEADPQARQKAKGLLATNLVMPGLGSLADGRKVGLVQLVLCLVGFGLTMGCGIHFIYWSLAHWAEYQTASDLSDPWKPLRDLWQQARWPLLGIFLFLVSWVWALATSRSMLSQTAAKAPAPPGGTA